MAPAGRDGVVGVVVMGALVAALPHTAAFNVHPAPYRVLTHGGSRSFGHQVLQLEGGRLVVGAPAEAGEGRLFQCRVPSGECWELDTGGNSTGAHLGMALRRDGAGAIACGPGLSRQCERNVYSSGLCVLLDPRLRPRRTLAPGYQGCLPGLVDLVFLFDGSSSMSAQQFQTIRDFMRDVMEQLGNSSIRFGAVQFSSSVLPHFTLGDFAARPRPRQLLANVSQLGGLTDTFAAIAYVTQNIFTPAAGARAGAKRVLVIITDGDATDRDRGAIRQAEERDIIRYIIGIGNNFGSPDTRLYLSQFASQPSSEFVKVLESFEKLRGLFHDLQTKIYDIEGTSDLNRFHLELSSSGMSVEVAHGRRLTGAVGADNWAGGLVELEEGQQEETFVASPSLEENVTDAYLGYAVAGLRVPGRALVAAGAPRHLHVGAVVLFEVPEAAGGWRVLQTLRGEQVGSYFGASLCGLVQGGVTVALLVGAPTHYDGRRGGRVHLYRWREASLEEAGELRGVPGHPLGRFGASLAPLGDLDGDGLPEAAVGAPMEDEGRGAVYVFAGRPGGLEAACSQRLEGRAAAAGLRFFGRALDGGLDLTGDGLPDLAVGAEGGALVLRSRPVLSVTPSLTSDPARVPANGVDCSAPSGPALNLTLCLWPRLLTPAYRGDLATPLTFRLEVEPQRARGRGSFGAGLRSWEGQVAGEGRSCRHQELRIPPCLEDFVSPIRLALSLGLPHGDAPGPVLRPPAPHTWLEVPLEQRCGPDELCQADLWVRALAGEGPLLGAPGAELAVGLAVGNRAEDAYGAALRLRHPPGLAFRRARAARASAPVSITCWDAAVGQPWGLTCNISRPVLRAGWEVTVELTFDVLQNSSWDERVGLEATVTSDNEPPATTGDNAAAWAVPVRFALGLVASWQDDSTPYVNFSSRSPQPKTLQHRYRVETLLPPPHGSPRPELSVFVFLPHGLPHGVTVDDPQVRMEPGGPCVAVGQEEGEAAMGPELNQSIAEACPTPKLRPFRCPTAAPPPGALLLLLSATLRPPPDIQSPARPRFCSALRLLLPSPRFQAPPRFLRAQGFTEVELLREVEPLPVYVGGGVGGLLLLFLIAFGLFKCGFFKRSYRQRLDRAGEGQGEGEGPPQSGESPEGGTTPPEPLPHPLRERGGAKGWQPLPHPNKGGFGPSPAREKGGGFFFFPAPPPPRQGVPGPSPTPTKARPAPPPPPPPHFQPLPPPKKETSSPSPTPKRIFSPSPTPQKGSQPLPHPQTRISSPSPTPQKGSQPLPHPQTRISSPSPTPSPDIQAPPPPTEASVRALHWFYWEGVASLPLPPAPPLPPP